MIKINLVREGRAPVRGASGGGGGAASAGSGATNANNLFILGFLVIAVLLAGGWYLVKSRELAAKQADVELKRVEAQKLEAFEKRKEDLKKRIDTINDLKQNQKGPVRVMDRISQDLPDLVWLDRVALDGGQKTINVTGRGLNPNAIAIFIEQIKADPLFDEPSVANVTQTQTARGPDVYSFTMKFGFKFDDAPPAEGEEGKEAGSKPVTAR